MPLMFFIFGAGQTNQIILATKTHNIKLLIRMIETGILAIIDPNFRGLAFRVESFSDIGRQFLGGLFVGFKQFIIFDMIFNVFSLLLLFHQRN